MTDHPRRPGVHVAFTAHRSAVTGRGAEHLWDAWIECVEARGLASGGTIREGEHRYLVWSSAGELAEADREALVEWLGRRTDVVSSRVSPVITLD